MRQTLSKSERLTRKKIIEVVHQKGKSIKTPALIGVYHFVELPEQVPVQALFTVSKRIFKRAHDRNRVKRLLREAYRKQKHIVYNPLEVSGKQLALFFIFTGRQLPNYPYLHGKVLEVLKRLKKEIETNESSSNEQ